MAKREINADAIEQRLLELAYTTDTKITAPALAYFAPCSIDAAAKVLETLSARDRIQMDFEADGTVVYHVPARQRLAARAPLPRALAREVSLEPVRVASPLLAAVLSVIVPGAGHLYAGRFVAAIVWFFVVTAGYVLILPGLIFHLFNIISAAAAANRLNTPQRMQLAA